MPSLWPFAEPLLAPELASDNFAPLPACAMPPTSSVPDAPRNFLTPDMDPTSGEALHRRGLFSPLTIQGAHSQSACHSHWDQHDQRCSNVVGSSFEHSQVGSSPALCSEHCPSLTEIHGWMEAGAEGTTLT